MSDAGAFWRVLAERLEAGERVFVALVADNTRHSPGTIGARLLLSESGVRFGTIGGGIMEYKLLQRALDLLQRDRFPPEVLTLVHQKTGDGERSGMICAGSQTNLYSVCRPEVELAALQQIVAIVEGGRSGMVRIDRAGWAVDEVPPNLGRPAIELEQGSDGWLYREELLNRKRLAILGGGHCGLALARTMRRLGYEVVVYETRPDLGALPEERVSPVELVDDFRLAGAGIQFPDLTSVVVMTTDFPSDVKALAGVLPHPFPFVGVMGAPAKLTQILQQLGELGFSADTLARIHAPIGVGIPSHTPEEIAISVAAQLIAVNAGSPLTP